jgi:hypothetical protein
MLITVTKSKIRNFRTGCPAPRRTPCIDIIEILFFILFFYDWHKQHINCRRFITSSMCKELKRTEREQSGKRDQGQIKDNKAPSQLGQLGHISGPRGFRDPAFSKVKKIVANNCINILFLNAFTISFRTSVSRHYICLIISLHIWNYKSYEDII